MVNDLGIGLRGNQLKEYLKTIQLTAIQKEVLIGTLLGDASFSLSNGTPKYCLKFEQGKQHEAYVYHLFHIFKPIVGTGPSERTINRRKFQEGTEKPRFAVWFRTYQFTPLIFYYNLFYEQTFDPTNPKFVISKKKIVPKNIGKFLTPRAIAYWFMDDGSYENKTGMFHTQGFTKSESQLLCDTLLEKYGIEAGVTKDRDKYKIRVKTSSAKAFRELIKDYVIPVFQYKLMNI